MISYSSWKERQLSVTSLRLDANNPRIPDADRELAERELIEDLVEHDKVYDLAKSIADNGYYPGEALVIVEENGRKVVLEGNRRLCALKLLLSPEAAPDEKWERRFRLLSEKTSPDAIKKVAVVSAPNRQAANRLIMSRHTRSEIMQWGPLMKAKFYHRLLAGGLAVNDIQEAYGIAASEITDGVQMYTMYRVACALDLPEAVQKKIQNPRQFPMTTLERLYQTPAVLEFLGISFDTDRNLVGCVSPEQFKKGYKKIVTDIATEEISSRKLNTTEDIRKYLASFGDDTPDLKKKGSFTAETLLKGEKPKPTVSKAKTTRKAGATKPTALIPRTFTCEVANPRVNEFFQELRKIKVAQFPNAVALMLRGLLELGLWNYLNQTSGISELTAEVQAKLAEKKQNLPKDYAPALTGMMKYIARSDSGIITDSHLRKALRRLIDRKISPLSIDSLHQYVHNPYYKPDEGTLRGFWDQLAPLFKIILVDPKP